MTKLYDLECYRATSVELKKYIDALKYTLPISKSNVLGGVMIGSNIQITDDGTISVKNASLTEMGVVQLSDNISSNSTTMAATSNAVKKVNDKVNQKADTVHNHTKSEITDFAHTHDDRYYTESEIDSKISNVDNTSDINKPVSTAQQSAIDSAYENSNAYTDKKIADLINGAPTTLDTLGELANAMQEHEDVVSALNEAIGTKANQSELDTHTKNTTIHIVASERTNWNAAKTHADSAHAPSNAQANIIETVKVNGTTLVPSSKSVNIIVPTNNNQLTNGAGYITSSGTAKTISDVLPISKGGTGKTNGADALNTLINSLSTGDSTPTDTDYYISQYAGGGTIYTTFHRRPVSALWNYIKSKLATVATSGSYNDLSNKPTIPTVGNGTITITQNGAAKGSFTLNQSGNATIALTDNNTTYVEAGANLGLIKSGGDLTITDGVAQVNDDSHNHIIANIDGLQTILDGKAASSHTHSYLPLSGGTVTGATQFNNYLKLNAWSGYGTGTANFWYNANNKFVEIENATDLKLAGTKVSKEGHTHNYAGSSSAGGSATSAVKLDSSAGSATQPVYFSSGKPVACNYSLNKTVPSNAIFTDTTYTAGAGLSLSGNTFAHTNSITKGTAQGDASKTLSFGGTFTIPTVTYDAQGHITGKGTTTMTMPANPNTDTKNTAGSTDTSSKIFLVGATSQAANHQTYSDNEVYTTSGVLTTKSVQVGGGAATIQYNSSTESIDFVFA